VLGVARPQRGPAVRGPAREHPGVDVVVPDDQPVTGPRGEQRLRADLTQCAADPQDVPVDLGGRAPRWTVTPQLEQQLVDGEHVA
jgi:hypothetical protein